MATLTLKFDTFEDQSDIALALHGCLLLFARDNFKKYLRHLGKYENLTEKTAVQLFEEIEKKFFECFEDSYSKIE